MNKLVRCNKMNHINVRLRKSKAEEYILQDSNVKFKIGKINYIFQGCTLMQYNYKEKKEAISIRADREGVVTRKGTWGFYRNSSILLYIGVHFKY